MQWVEPVTGSSSIPIFGPKTLEMQSNLLLLAVTAMQRPSNSTNLSKLGLAL